MSQEFPLIPHQNLNSLKESLNFLHMEELKEICTKLLLPTQEKKGALILRILHFIEFGKVIKAPKIPDISCARRGENYPLHPTTCILKGNYKNDLTTRLFFKKLIGEHFHFTAFGVDWLNNRWIQGKPPTYQEFADMWTNEIKRRKEEGSHPKEEWAYINFTQKFMRQNPNSQRHELLEAWEKERQRQKENVTKIMQMFK
ncbi:MAG: hypothetical protein B7Y25_07240 [Alphaproteobacteria bacterium 16-39-46]|nr:MAG: hypothetical protein B7Y25_07240 [Alphaproteobacteria bacterium 16-39-46]OZA41801.1 MAG: hypothetical protein B7X84_07395 [Alphaproteobacteria bacterium 17-39-52]HQS84703.1 hypothetical protein [Alphaproteobacteria bacterium]HQS94524.1 hypothetical protein [Alphaproteobacteria bacterium]